ncbi:MAG: hypothetical protein ACRDGI_02580 [Candidatus Limnocylindrales bacterium]
MSTKFETLGENRPVRLLGAVAALAPGGLALLATVRADAPDWSWPAATLILGVALGWIFAPRAANPGWRDGLHAVAAVTLWGVVLGSFLVVALSVDYSNGDGPGVILVFGVVGLIFLGIPMMLVTFVVATAWVGIVKLGVRLGLVGLAPDGAS